MFTLYFISILFWCPVLCDVCPRRKRLLNEVPIENPVSCLGKDYSAFQCVDFLKERGYSKLADVQFPKIQQEGSFQPVETLAQVQNLSELVGIYMCCEISKVNIWDYKKLSFIYEEFCDANYAHFTHHKEILELGKKNFVKVGNFAALVSFCPARIVKQNPSSDVATPWKKIRPAVDLNENVQNTKVVNGECKKNNKINLENEQNTLTILLADEDMYYGTLKAFWGPVDQLSEDKFMIWAADEAMYSIEIVRNIHGTPAKLYPMKVSRAIQFKGIDVENVKTAWEKWIQQKRYSLLNRSCVHAMVHLVQAALGNELCEFNEELQFPFPIPTLEQFVEIGIQTTMGSELAPENVNEIQVKINNIMREKEEKLLAESHSGC